MGGGGGCFVSWLLTSRKADLSTDLKRAGGSDRVLTLLGLLQTVCQVGGRPGAAAVRQLGPAHHQGQQDRTGDQVVSHSATLLLHPTALTPQTLPFPPAKQDCRASRHQWRAWDIWSTSWGYFSHKACFSSTESIFGSYQHQ